MHVCMHACMYACMYACMHVCMYVYESCFITKKKIQKKYTKHSCTFLFDRVDTFFFKADKVCATINIQKDKQISRPYL